MRTDLQIYYLIYGFLHEWCDFDFFCDNYSELYGFELDDDLVDKVKLLQLRELSERVDRSANDKHFELYPNEKEFLYTSSDVTQKALEVDNPIKKISKNEFLDFVEKDRGYIAFGIDIGAGYLLCPKCKANAIKADVDKGVLVCDDECCKCKFNNPLAKVTSWQHIDDWSPTR